MEAVDIDELVRQAEAAEAAAAATLPSPEEVRTLVAAAEALAATEAGVPPKSAAVILQLSVRYVLYMYRITYLLLVTYCMCARGACEVHAFCDCVGESLLTHSSM